MPALRSGVVETTELPINRVYRSMQGPYARVGLDPSGLDWVTGIRTEVVDTEDGTPMGEEFFCHSQVQIGNGSRLLTMATGAAEIRFPAGFAMPLAEIVADSGGGAISFLGMVLNNHEPLIDEVAKVRATFDFFRDGDFGSNARPRRLYAASLIMQVDDLEEYTGGDGPAMDSDVTTHCALVEQPLGGKLPLHWIVPPGVQKTRNRIDGLVPIDGTVHFAWVHLHNYARYMRLVDVTTGEVLFQADVTNESNRDQIAHIGTYSSEQGFPIFKGRSYEIEALYDNTTAGDVDAMAMMVLYYHPEGNRRVRYRASGS